MESEAMNATVSTSHLDFSGKMKERRNGILKKTKYNASLISKIKTKILNNSSMMKISLKNNNKALALALAEEKKKYRMAEQEKVILQKEIYTQNYDIVMLQQRLKTQNAKLSTLEDSLMKIKSCFFDATNYLSAAINTCECDFQEHQWNGMLFQRSNSVNEDSGSNLNTRLPSGVPPNFRIEEINQASSSQDDKINSLKEAVAVLVDGSTSLMGALACQAFTVNLHENVSINDPNIREHVEVGRPSQDRVSNHTRFSQNFRTSTMYSVPQISLTEQTPETWLSGAMSENQNITLRKKDSCSRSSKISMELMEKNGTSLTRESHSRISNASDISEFNKTSLVVPQVRITPVRYSSQLFDLKRSSTNLFAEKQSDEPWKSELTIFDAEMDLTTSEAVEIVTVATKSTKHKIKKAKGEKVKVEASSKNVETLRKVKRPKEKNCNSTKRNCNIEYLVCKKKQRKHSEEVSVFDQGFINNNEEPIVGIPNNGPNDWLMHEDSIPNSQEDYRQVVSASKENICNMKGKAEKKTCRVAESVKGSTSNLIVPGARGDYHEVELNEHLNNVEVSSGISNALQDQLDNVKENIGHGTFVVTEKYHSIKESTSNPVIQTKKDYDVEMAEHPDIKDYGNLNNKNTSRRTFVVTEEHKSIRDNTTKSIWQEKPRKHHNIKESTSNPVVQKRTEHDVEMAEHPDIEDYGNLNNKNSSRRTFVVTEEHKSIRDNATKSIGQEKLRNQNIMVTDNYQDSSEENIGIKGKANQRVEKLKSVKDNSSKSVGQRKLRKQSVMVTDEYSDNLEEVCRTHDASEENTGNKRKASLRRFVVCKEQKTVKDGSPNSVIWQKGKEQHEVEVAERLGNLEICNPNNEDNQKTIVVPKRHKKLSKWEKCREQQEIVIDNLVNIRLDNLEKSNKNSNTIESDISNEKCKADRRTFVISKERKSVKESSSKLTKVEKDEEQYVTAEHFPSTEGSSGTSDTLQDYIKEIADQRTFVANKIPMNVAHSSNLLVEIQDKKQCLTDVNQHLNRFERGSNKSYNQNADISPEDFTNIKKRLDRSIVVYKNIEKDPTQSALPVKKALQYEVKKVQVECEQNTHKILKNDWTSISEKGSKPGRKICINGPSESAPQLPMEDNLATAVRSKVQENKECEVLKDVTNVIPTKLLHQSQLSLRCKRQTTAGLSYKEPSLGRKLRQGDAFTDSRFLHSPVPKTGQKVKKRCGAQNLHK